TIVALTAAFPVAQHKATDVPVDFNATINATGSTGTVATTIKVHVDRYTSDRDRQSLLDSLRRDGYQAFLPAFRKAPVVGYVQIKDQKWDLRGAHHETSDKGQTVTVATDQPIYFIGGGRVDAKPRAGYEMGIVRLEVDGIGMGSGTIAAAARVKPSADGAGVDVDDYADTPTKITMVTRIFS